MRKYFFVILALLLCCVSINAQKAVRIFHHGKETPDVIMNYNIDSIYIADNNGVLSQVFATAEGIVSYPLESIDRIKFQLDENESLLCAYTHHIYAPVQTDKVGFLVAKINVGYDSPQLSGSSEYVTDLREAYGDGSMVKMDAHINSCPEEGREFAIPIELGNLRDTVYVHQLPIPPFYDDNRPIEHHVINVFTPEEQTKELSTSPLYKGRPAFMDFDWIKIEETNADWINAERSDDGSKINIYLSENAGDVRTTEGYWIDSDFTYTGPRFPILQLHAGVHSANDHLSALRDIYDATGAQNGPNSENWWSDKPLYQWSNINQEGRLYDSDRVLTITLDGINGMVSPSFATIVDDALGISYGNCTFFGKVPQEVTNSPQWNKFGWDFIERDPFWGNDIDFEGINLKLEDIPVKDYKTDEICTAYDILKRHKLTWIINLAADESADSFDGDAFVNKYLDYRDKGLGLVFARYQYVPEEKSDNYIDDIKGMEEKGLPTDIIWTDTFGNAIKGSLGSMSLIDENGNLVWYGKRDFSMTDFYIEHVDKYCQDILGTPVEHDPFVYNRYTSSDYTKDGIYTQIYAASSGKGVNLVFMGDGFTDRDIEQGVYQSTMQNHIDCIMSTEPVKSLKDRFNVYVINVVSPNDFTAMNSRQRINESLTIVHEYLSLIPDLDLSNTHVAVIENRNDIMRILRSHCELAPPGMASLSWIKYADEDEDNTISHEMVGHGIGKLGDEYIEPGYEENKIPDEDRELFIDSFVNAYHSNGFFLNLSYSDVPAYTPWAHMFEDEDYKNIVGLYMGASMWPYDIWRSSDNSVMRDNYESKYFNAPSREQIYRKVMAASEDDNWSYSWEQFKEFDKISLTQISEDQQSKKVRRNSAPRQKHNHTRCGGVIIHTQSNNGIYPSCKIAPVIERKNVINIPNNLSKGYILVSGERIDIE